MHAYVYITRNYCFEFGMGFHVCGCELGLVTLNRAAVDDVLVCSRTARLYDTQANSHRPFCTCPRCS